MRIQRDFSGAREWGFGGWRIQRFGLVRIGPALADQPTSTVAIVTIGDRATYRGSNSSIHLALYVASSPLPLGLCDALSIDAGHYVVTAARSAGRVRAVTSQMKSRMSWWFDDSATFACRWAASRRRRLRR